MTEQTQESPSNVPLQRFEGPSFELMVPTTWLAMATPDYQAAFIGPMVGKVRMTLTVTMAKNRPNATFTDLVDGVRQSQSTTHEDYVVMNEEEIEGEFPFMARYYRWYDAKADQVIFQRQLLLLTNNFAYIVAVNQPNHEKFQLFDVLFLQMLTTFQVGNLDIS